ncbi:hypothetical protein N7468_006012 [Penicillium chermesinum]|uniref:Uncharacterized protein n=1 Tax=Penicillium chermesinum TaxID=63820 RepID=A0A9W9P088_9EURO|nr:uncharacterized protein N7468_006012 [Penicillium chermesinum]KAJ5233056.1 hypothetical protein N7468_006012 [Penicillium chermesinum]KAJ6172695.1 hypothetical protein N7470_001762 [Penicillium chermesinum]
MSAPNSGRQSPPEERQSGIQQGQPPATGKMGASSSAPPQDFAQQKSDETKNAKLESNPAHPLGHIEAEKFAKTK